MEFFLVNQNETQIKVVSQAAQTDPFHKQDKEQLFKELQAEAFAFRGKKTGKDAATQINRFDFFDFEKEVWPILDVLTSKTLEQSQLEVYEEEMLSQMRQFKDILYKKSKTKVIHENKKCECSFVLLV